MAIASVNPTTGETVRSFEPDSPAALDTKLTRAARVFHTWSRSGIDARAAILSRTAALMKSEIEALAALATDEMGKTIRAARDEVGKCAATLLHYAQNAARWLEPEAVDGPDQAVWFEPLGRGAGRDALEFSLLAGDPVRGARAGRRQRRRCSSTPRTFPAARWRSSTCSGERARPRACSRRC